MYLGIKKFIAGVEVKSLFLGGNCNVGIYLKNITD